MRRAPPRGRRPVVPAVEEHHGAGRPRRRARPASPTSSASSSTTPPVTTTASPAWRLVSWTSAPPVGSSPTCPPTVQLAETTVSHELRQQKHIDRDEKYCGLYTRAETSAWEGSSRRWRKSATATARPCSARRTTSGRRQRHRGSRAGRSRGSGVSSGRLSSTRAGRTGTNRSSSCRTARAATSRSSSSTGAPWRGAGGTSSTSSWRPPAPAGSCWDCSPWSPASATPPRWALPGGASPASSRRCRHPRCSTATRRWWSRGTRTTGAPDGSRSPGVRGDAIQDEGAAGGDEFQGAGGADDVHQRRRRADDGEAGVLGRRLQPGPGDRVRRRRWGRQFGEHTGSRHGDRRRSEAGVLQVRQDRRHVSRRRCL
ncbi:hypothetical protein DAI22_10g033900 [Oryza sativa Japonica Group]|nr:hypothetical protein DAI22_10g033900 [Oryza sativa Japonica Group]